MTSETESNLAPLGLHWMRQSYDPFGKTEWGLLLAGSAVCAIVALATAGALGVPHEPGFNGSLLCGTAPVQSLVVYAIATLICAIPAVLFGILLGVEGAAFCLGVGLTAIAARCGGVRSILQYSADGKPLMVMAVETAVVTAIAYGGWLSVAWGSASVRKLAGADPIPVDKTADIPIPWNSILVQVAVTAVGAILLVQTDQPSQAIGGLALAVIAGVLGSYLSSDVTAGKWYWFTPALAGVVGFIFAWMTGAKTVTGDLQGYAAGLARVTPLDYAGVGLAAGVFGRWVARRWGQEDETTAVDPAIEEPQVLVKPMPTVPPPPSTL